MNGIKRSITPHLLSIIAICCVLLVLSGCTTQQAAVKAGDTIRVHYTVSFPDGTVVQSTMNGTPLEFTVGNQSVIPGFNDAVIGMSPGQTKTVTIPAENAYGPYRPELVNTLSTSAVRSFLAELQANKSLAQINFSEIGPVYIWKKPDGQVGYLRFTNITANTTTVDENHPLAGKDLVFEITLVEIVNKTG
jgi:peptidylprolyl isomerase